MTKFCVNCIYFRDVEHQVPGAKHEVCEVKIEPTILNLVTGRKEYPLSYRDARRNPYMYRKEGGVCGPEAELFEPIISTDPTLP